MRIKVEVWDSDNNGDDKVDYLKTNPALSLTPSRFDRDATWMRTTLRGRTRFLDTDIRLGTGRISGDPLRECKESIPIYIKALVVRLNGKDVPQFPIEYITVSLLCLRKNSVA